MMYLGIDQHARQLTISLHDESGDVAVTTSTRLQIAHCDVIGREKSLATYELHASPKRSPMAYSGSLHRPRLRDRFDSRSDSASCMALIFARARSNVA